jgi:hypothetical protein
MSTENKLELLTEGYTILRQAVPLDLIALASYSINEAIALDNELIHQIGKVGGTDRADMSDRAKL